MNAINLRGLAAFAAWSMLAIIVFLTLCPIEFRPVVAPSEVERFVAFGLAGSLFGVAYPRKILLVALLVIGSAVALELMQRLVPGRHGRMFDADVKIVGACLGIASAIAVNIWARRSGRFS